MNLFERMTFDQLYRLSEPKRKVRALTVTGPPLRIHAFNSQTMWEFNFKASPSTTGLRHHGYIRFYKPSRPKPLQNLECMLDCDCFSGDTLVLMGDGTYRPIKEVEIGDGVYTHAGRVKKVTNVMSRSRNEGENVWRVRVTGSIAPLTVTGNHPFFALRGNDSCLCGCGGQIPNREDPVSPLKILGVKHLTGHHKRGLSDLPDKSGGVFEWVSVDDFRKKEWFLSPWLDHAVESEVSPDFARLVGYYLAEGCIPSRTVEQHAEYTSGDVGRAKTVRLAFNVDETDTLVADVKRICEVLGYGFKLAPWRRSEDHPYTGVTVSVYSHEFAQFCHGNVGCGSNAKKLSREVLGWSLDNLAQLYVGFQLGDGNVSDRLARCFSVNRNLISQISTILRKLHIQHRLTLDSTTGMWTLSICSGDDLNEVLSWLGPMAPGGKMSSEISPQFKRAEGYLVGLSSRELDPEFNDLVYDLTVDGDHSFIANGVAVHNCHDFKYRFAWIVKQKGSSTVGARSMNQALNRAPRITNPTGKPGLCKHLLALKEYIYGLYSNFPDSQRQFTPQVMDKMVKYANNKWVNMDTELERARVRDQRAAAIRAARNRGQEMPPPIETDEVPDEVPAGVTSTPAALPATTPAALPATTPSASATVPAAQMIQNQVRPETPSRRRPPGRNSTESLVLNPEKMKTTTKKPDTRKLSEQVTSQIAAATKLVEDCDLGTGTCALGAESPMDMPMAASPEAAEGSEALSLLRQIVDLLAKLSPDNPDAEADLDTDLNPDLDGEGGEGGDEGGEKPGNDPDGEIGDEERKLATA